PIAARFHQSAIALSREAGRIERRTMHFHPAVQILETSHASESISIRQHRQRQRSIRLPQEMAVLAIGGNEAEPPQEERYRDIALQRPEPELVVVSPFRAMAVE